MQVSRRDRLLATQQIVSIGMAQPKVLKATHHETPVWLDDRGGAMKVEKAGFVNHNSNTEPI